MTDLKTLEAFLDKNSYTKFDEDELFTIWTLRESGMSYVDIWKHVWSTDQTVSRLHYNDHH